MNACVSGKRRLSGKGGDLVSDTVQVIRGGEFVRKVLSSHSDGQAVIAAGFQKVKGGKNVGPTHRSLSLTKVMRRLTTGIHSQKCVDTRFRRCATVI